MIRRVRQYFIPAAIFLSMSHLVLADDITIAIADVSPAGKIVNDRSW